MQFSWPSCSHHQFFFYLDEMLMSGLSRSPSSLSVTERVLNVLGEEWSKRSVGMPSLQAVYSTTYSIVLSNYSKPRAKYLSFAIYNWSSTSVNRVSEAILDEKWERLCRKLLIMTRISKSSQIYLQDIEMSFLLLLKIPKGWPWNLMAVLYWKSSTNDRMCIIHLDLIQDKFSAVLGHYFRPSGHVFFFYPEYFWKVLQKT